MMQHSVKVWIALSLTAGFVQAGCDPHPARSPVAAAVTTQLTVLTQEAMLPQTKLAAEYYQARASDVGIQIITARDQQELVDIAAAMAATGQSPDVIVADHFLGGALDELGLIAGYCLPDSGCEACFTNDPPWWCRYAEGVEVDVGRIENFSMVGLCDIDTCPDVCLQTPMPQWCLLIHAPGHDLIAPDFGYDVIRGAFARRYPEYDGCFPWGIPWWWRTHTIWVSEQLGFQPGQLVPREAFEQLINDFQDMLYFDSTVVFDQLGIAAPFEPNLRKGDPDPEPSLVALLLGFTDTVQRTSEELRASLVPVRVEGYRPQAVISGAYVVPSGAAGAAGVAMDFAYTVFADEFQGQMAAIGEYLPVQNEAFASATQAFLPAGTSDVLLFSVPSAPGAQ